MATAQEFGKAILIMQAEDSALAATLKKDEALVTASVGKMQGKINTLSLAQKDLSGTASAASASVATLGIVATLTGSQSLVAAAGVAQLTTAMVTQAAATTSATAALVKFGAAMWALLATPLGVMLTLFAAQVVVVTRASREWNAEQKEAAERAEKVRERIDKQREAIQKQARALAEQIKIAKGALPSELETDPILKRLKAEKEEVTEVMKLQAAEQAREDARLGRIAALQQETQILQGQKTALDFIADADERAATAARDRAKATKEAAQAAKDEAKAAQDARRGLGFFTPSEARARLAEIELEQAGARTRERALRAAFAERFGLEEDFKVHELGAFQRRLAESLGFGGIGGRQPLQGGAIATTAFTTGNAGLFAAGAAPDPAQQRRDREATEGTKAAKETATNTGRIATLMTTGNGLGP